MTNSILKTSQLRLKDDIAETWLCKGIHLTSEITLIQNYFQSLSVNHLSVSNELHHRDKKLNLIVFFLQIPLNVYGIRGLLPDKNIF